MATFVKTVKPLDYQIDYAAWLPTGDPIATSTWSVPAGITKDSDSFTDDDTTIILSGGTVGQTYEIENTITTTNGLGDVRCFDVFITDCR
jgi:hypothetical protein